MWLFSVWMGSFSRWRLFRLSPPPAASLRFQLSIFYLKKHKGREQHAPSSSYFLIPLSAVDGRPPPPPRQANQTSVDPSSAVCLSPTAPSRADVPPPQQTASRWGAPGPPDNTHTHIVIMPGAATRYMLTNWPPAFFLTSFFFCLVLFFSGYQEIPELLFRSSVPHSAIKGSWEVWPAYVCVPPSAS